MFSLENVTIMCLTHFYIKLTKSCGRGEGKTLQTEMTLKLKDEHKMKEYLKIEILNHFSFSISFMCALNKLA